MSKYRILGTLLAAFAAAVHANTINYQAKLTGFVPSASGTIGLKFEIFAMPTGGSALYTELQHNVPIQDGVVSTEIGLIAPISDDFFATDNTHNYLQVSADTDHDGSFETVISPRTSLLPSVPHAFEANHALMADSLSGTAGGSLSGLRVYDAIVGAGGTFSSLSGALSAGKKNIFVKSGNYSETHQVQIIADNVNVTGESPTGVQITINAPGAPAFQIRKADTFTYSAGTINVVFGSASVGGTLANFSDVQPGDLLVVSDAVYKISSASSNNLTLSEPYAGHNKVGVEYDIIRPLTGTRLTNLTFKTADNSQPVIAWSNGYTGELNNVIVAGGAPDLELNNCIQIKTHFSQFLSAATDNVELSECDLCQFTDCTIAKAVGNGVMSLGGRSNLFTSCNIADNGGRGWFSGAMFDKIANCTISNNGGAGLGAGIYMNGIGQTAQGNSTTGNVGAGVFVNANLCLVGSNQISSNLGNGVDVEGNSANLASNIISQNDIGIHLHSSNDATMVGNSLRGNSNDTDYDSSSGAFPDESSFGNLNHVF